MSPSLELSVKVSKSGRTSVSVLNPHAHPGPLAALIRRTDEGVALVMEAVQVEINADGGMTGLPDVRAFYESQFDAADGDNNKYLDVMESRRNGVFDDETFKMMDRDGDGKLFKNEMSDFAAQDADMAESRTLLSVTDHGRSLFDILDLNRDHRLSVRELRAAPKKIATWDRDGDGQVGGDEIPRHFRLSFGRGRSNLLSRFGFVTFAVVTQTPSVGDADAGPPWFRNMDRNHDGDVSPREFLGPRTIFQRLDADADGLIDAGEAGKAR